ARSVFEVTLGCLAGALLYRLAVALALNTDFLGLRPSDVQLVTAVLVGLTLVWQAHPAKKRAKEAPGSAPPASTSPSIGERRSRRAPCAASPCTYRNGNS